MVEFVTDCGCYGIELRRKDGIRKTIITNRGTRMRE
jgi:hypothetical protein